MPATRLRRRAPHRGRARLRPWRRRHAKARRLLPNRAARAKSRLPAEVMSCGSSHASSCLEVRFEFGGPELEGLARAAQARGDGADGNVQELRNLGRGHAFELIQDEAHTQVVGQLVEHAVEQLTQTLLVE